MSDLMRCTLDEPSLARYVAAQVNGVFPDSRPVGHGTLGALLPSVLERVEHCFTRIGNKYFFDGNSAMFNHLNGDQYAMFLYMMARSAFRSGITDGTPEKLYLLNKALHGIDAFYEVELPRIFFFVHPVGTVLGRARYSDYLAVYQRCSVGSNHDVYPTLGEHVTLRPGSAVLGRCTVGRDCTIAAESLLLDRDLPDGSVYTGNPRDYVVRQSSGELMLWRT